MGDIEKGKKGLAEGPGGGRGGKNKEYLTSYLSSEAVIVTIDS